MLSHIKPEELREISFIRRRVDKVMEVRDKNNFEYLEDLGEELTILQKNLMQIIDVEDSSNKGQMNCLVAGDNGSLRIVTEDEFNTNGFECISILIDSGASGSVLPKFFLHGCSCA